MSARDEILAGVRRALGASPNDAARRAAVEARIGAAAPGLRPARGQGDGAARALTFIDEAQRVNATIERVGALADVPEAAARYLRERNLAARLRMGDDARLTSLPWGATHIDVGTGASAGDDPNSISFAEAGVAETGTLVFVSGAHNPTTLNFLPDNHIAVLRAADLEADYEAVWARLRERFGKGHSSPHGELRHRPLALGRHRAEAPSGRARPKKPAHYRRGRMTPHTKAVATSSVTTFSDGSSLSSLIWKPSPAHMSSMARFSASTWPWIVRRPASRA